MARLVSFSIVTPSVFLDFIVTHHPVPLVGRLPLPRTINLRMTDKPYYLGVDLAASFHCSTDRHTRTPVIFSMISFRSPLSNFASLLVPKNRKKK